MKIATWNINSLAVRLPQVLDWLGANQPDVLCLQETKLPDDKFTQAEFKAGKVAEHYKEYAAGKGSSPALCRSLLAGDSRRHPIACKQAPTSGGRSPSARRINPQSEAFCTLFPERREGHV